MQRRRGHTLSPEKAAPPGRTALVKFGRTLESQVARLGRGRTVTLRRAATGSCGLRLVARSLPVRGSPGLCAPRIWVIRGNGACRATLPTAPCPRTVTVAAATALATLVAASNNVYRRALSLPY